LKLKKWRLVQPKRPPALTMFEITEKRRRSPPEPPTALSPDELARLVGRAVKEGDGPLLLRISLLPRGREPIKAPSTAVSSTS